MTPLESRPVVFEDRTIGAAIRPTAGSHRPIFVSPGHRLDAAFAESVVRRLLRGRRLPEPLYWADRFSRAAARDAKVEWVAENEPRNMRKARKRGCSKG
jgi:deoxyribonuclease V